MKRRSNKAITKEICQLIPLAKQMGLQVRINPKVVVLSAPLRPNRNHVNSGFGGSLYGSMATATWVWWREFFMVQGLNVIIVMAESRVKFFRPVRTNFKAEFKAPSERKCAEILNTLKKSGVIQNVFVSHIYDSKRNLCAELKGDFHLRLLPSEKA